MRCSLTSELDNWPRVAETNRDPVSTLVDLGLERREARWLVEEFLPGGDLEEMPYLLSQAKRRLNGEPLQYIIGHWPFRSLDLDVDPRVLIPRPETEELVDVALGVLEHSTNTPLLVDLGCGSGAIGLAMACELRERGILATLLCVDESADALDVARRNARKHNVLTASFIQSSWFDQVDISLQGRVDVIVSNPPYVGEAEFETLDPVLRYEPLGALVAPDASGHSGFDDIAQILNEAQRWLRPGGVLVMEHGEGQRVAILDFAQKAGWVEYRDLDDLSGRPRIFVGRRP
jgi:release factor glutamine methyltransferase